MRQVISRLLLAMPISLTAAQEEDVYRWTDEQGSTHYSNELPDDVQAERVDLNSQPVEVTAGEHVYKWEDSEGNIHYGDQPPTDKQARKIELESKSMSTIRATAVRPGEEQLLREY